MRGPSARAAERCWGAHLQGDASGCRFTRKRDMRHFKSKFCARCQWSLAVPANRVRALSDEVAMLLENRRSAGMWTAAPPRMGGFLYRIVNNTQGCFKPKLLVFEKEPPPGIPWPAVAPYLCDADGMVRMCVSKGTIVPIPLVRDPHRAKGPPPELETDTETEAALEPEPEPESEPELESESEFEPEAGAELLNLDWFAPELESLEALGPLLPVTECMPELGSEPEPVVAMVVEESCSKKEVRMHRNRMSAARSRQMKREYIERLESRVDELSRTVEELQKENWYWRSLDATMPNEVLHAEWCVCNGGGGVGVCNL